MMEPVSSTPVTVPQVPMGGPADRPFPEAGHGIPQGTGDEGLPTAQRL